jgi:hypothetical protein
MTEPFTDMETAKTYIGSYAGDVQDFELPISDSINDPLGLTMALLLDTMLKKGWEPDGFEQQEGYRVYKYKISE